ncbi:MAG: hypothetical protein ACRD47_13190 [Nitrososphaeraceae archaeon]
MKKYNHDYGIIVAGGLVLAIVLSSISTMADTQLSFAQMLGQQQDMNTMSDMNDKMMMRDANMSSTANMSDMMMIRMMDMMDRMNKMMDMMMMDMSINSDTTGMMSMSNGNVNMGSMQNQTGDMMR